MKRLYLTIALVIVCLAIGFVEMGTIKYSTDRCLENIKNIEIEVENENFDEAEKICKQATAEYENISGKIMFCYYPHSNLENVAQNLSLMTETLKNNNIQLYKVIREKTEKQLHAIKEEELFTIQNIL